VGVLFVGFLFGAFQTPSLQAYDFALFFLPSSVNRLSFCVPLAAPQAVCPGINFYSTPFSWSPPILKSLTKTGPPLFFFFSFIARNEKVIDKGRSRFLPLLFSFATLHLTVLDLSHPFRLMQATLNVHLNKICAFCSFFPAGWDSYATISPFFRSFFPFPLNVSIYRGPQTSMSAVLVLIEDGLGFFFFFCLPP